MKALGTEEPAAQTGFLRLNQSEQRTGGEGQIGFGASNTTRSPVLASDLRIRPPRHRRLSSVAVKVRLATAHDIPALLSLVRRYWDFEGIEDFTALRVELVLKRLLADTGLGMVWVAESDTQLLGYLIAVLVFSIEHQGLMAEIDEFFVIPCARTHGIGAQLLAVAEPALAARGCVRLQLQLAVGNEPARSFYQRRGFAARAGYELLDKPLSANP